MLEPRLVYERKVYEWTSDDGVRFCAVIQKGKIELFEDYPRPFIPGGKYPTPEDLQLCYDSLDEIKLVWKAILHAKRDLGAADWKENREEWHVSRDAAMACLKAHPDWQYLTAAILRPRTVYHLRDGRDRADFIAKVWQQVLAARNRADYGVDLLGRIAQALWTT